MKAKTARFNQPFELDELHALVWKSVRRIFPPEAIATMPRAGCIFVTWSTRGDPGASSPYASPIMLTLEAELLASLRGATPDAQRQIASRQEEVIKAGMVGYEPYEKIPNARVIVLG